MGSSSSSCCKNTPERFQVHNVHGAVSVARLKIMCRNNNVDPKTLLSFHSPPLQSNTVVEDRTEIVEVHNHFFPVSNIPVNDWLHRIKGVDRIQGVTIRLSDVQRKEFEDAVQR